MKKKQLLIENMSDQKLREALKKFNVLPGPITDSTRNLYVRKLASLMQDTEMLDDDNDTDTDMLDNDNDTDTDRYTTEHEDTDIETEDTDTELRIPSAHITSSKLNWLSRTILYSAVSFLAVIFAYRFCSNRQYESKILLFGSMIFLPLIYGIYKLYCYYSKRCHQEHQRVCDLIDEALQLLQSPDNPKCMMPILHIRDTLLTPSERNSKKMIGIWNKAVKFVEQRESRVRVELVNIDGEDFRAWKWIGNIARE